MKHQKGRQLLLHGLAPPKADQGGCTLWEEQGVVTMIAPPHLCPWAVTFSILHTLECQIEHVEERVVCGLFFDYDIHHILSNALAKNDGQRQAFIVNTGLPKWLLLLVILFLFFFFFCKRKKKHYSRKWIFKIVFLTVLLGVLKCCKYDSYEPQRVSGSLWQGLRNLQSWHTLFNLMGPI